MAEMPPETRPAAPPDSIVIRNGVPLIVPAIWSGHDRLRAAISTRQGGVSGGSFGMNTSFKVGDREEFVRANRSRFFGAAGIPEAGLATTGQVHGTALAEVETPGRYPGYDGLITATAGTFLAVTVADCLPILFWDETRGVAAIVHSGWRGSRGRIAEACVRRLAERYGCRPADLQVYIGPGARGCCYEVGPEVAAGFPPENLRVEESGRTFLDLGLFNRSLLVRSGIREESISASARCTIHESETFHSHRRDGIGSGRMTAAFGFV